MKKIVLEILNEWAEKDAYYETYEGIDFDPPDDESYTMGFNDGKIALARELRSREQTEWKKGDMI